MAGEDIIVERSPSDVQASGTEAESRASREHFDVLIVGAGLSGIGANVAVVQLPEGKDDECEVLTVLGEGAPRFGKVSNGVNGQQTDGEDVEMNGADESSAEEALEVGVSGEPLTIGFNAGYLLDGLTAVRTPRATLSFTTATRPTVITPVAGLEPSDGPGAGEDTYRYLVMSMRLRG